MTSKLITSPVGEIVWMAAEKPFKEKDGTPKFSIRLAFDEDKDSEFLREVSKVNSAKVVTKSTYRGDTDYIKEILADGKALVSAATQFKPTVYNLEGTEMETAPYFGRSSSGTAQMIVEPYVSEKGGTLNLIGIIIHEIETPEGEGVDRETKRAELEAAVALATGKL